MKCGRCKAVGPEIDVAHVRDCYATTYSSVPEQRVVNQDEPWWYGNGGKALPFPEGRYAILTPGEGVDGKLHFFKIDAPTEGKWSGYVFVKEQAGDELFNVKGRRGAMVVDLIAKDPENAMLMYGQELGRCGHCGRTLTDEDSRAAGIGPVCRNKVSF